MSRTSRKRRPALGGGAEDLKVFLIFLIDLKSWLLLAIFITDSSQTQAVRETTQSTFVSEKSVTTISCGEGVAV